MALLSLQRSQSTTAPNRLVFTSVSSRQNRIAAQVSGAVVGKPGSRSVYFPVEPNVVSDLTEVLGQSLEITDEAAKWYRQSQLRDMKSLALRTLPDFSTHDATRPWMQRLYPYQRIGATWLRYIDKGILGDDPGLGKTIQALTAAAGCPKVLIVTLNSVKSHWAAHCNTWLNQPCTVPEGTHAQRQAQINASLAAGNDWLIVNHEMLRTGQNRYLGLAKTKWDVVIVDEAHKFQGRTSRQSKGAELLKTQRLFLLTGTPVWNNPDSIWHLLRLIDPYRFGSYWRFVTEYCAVTKTPFGTEVGGVLPDKMERLQAILAPLLLRRTKRDVLPDLPAKVRVNVPWVPTAAQIRQYRHIKKVLSLVDENGGAVKYFASLASALSSMRLLLSCPENFDDLHILGLRENPKNVVLRELLETLEGRKVIVFTWHKTYAHYLGEKLRTDTENPVVVTGDMDARTREEVLGAFRRSHDHHILVATIGAIGTGIDLVEASAAIFAEGSYVPSLNRQAEDRLHRIGQTTDVTIYRLEAAGTVEAAIWELSDTREDVVNEMLATNELVQLVLEKEQRDELS